MQTFLPFPDFAQSARVLDRQRLGKQRVEAKQILRALCGESIGRSGWRNHPATLMWKGYEAALCLYGDRMIEQWCLRGYNNTMSFVREADEHGIEYTFNPKLPPWLGSPAFHASHRAALLFKAPEWYGQFGWSEAPKLDYVWPVLD